MNFSSASESMQRIVRRNDRAKQEASKTKRPDTFVAVRRQISEEDNDG